LKTTTLYAPCSNMYIKPQFASQTKKLKTNNNLVSAQKRGAEGG
jgi:hypothetical protein